MFLNEDVDLRVALESLDMALEVENPLVDRFKKLFQSNGSSNRPDVRNVKLKFPTRVRDSRDIENCIMNIIYAYWEIARKEKPDLIPIALSFGEVSNFAEVAKKYKLDLTKATEQEVEEAFRKAGGFEMWSAAFITYLVPNYSKEHKQIYCENNYVLEVEKNLQHHKVDMEDLVNKYSATFILISVDLRNYQHHMKWADKPVNGLLSTWYPKYDLTDLSKLKIRSFDVKDYIVRQETRRKALRALGDIHADNAERYMATNEPRMWYLTTVHSKK